MKGEDADEKQAWNNRESQRSTHSTFEENDKLIFRVCNVPGGSGAKRPFRASGDKRLARRPGSKSKKKIL